MKGIVMALLALLLTAPALAAMKPEHLRCEYLINPLGIDAPTPRLSWEVPLERRGTRQIAYQVIVEENDKNVKSGALTVWDSGKVASDQTAQIAYAGKPLQSGTRYVWRVRLWDEHDKPSDWSANASWEMGLLSPADWNGKWIGRTNETAYQPAPILRRKFHLQNGIRRARLYVCGLGYYELHCNGRKVGDHLLDPGYTRFDRRALYVTYDLTPYLKSGENALGVILGTGWYNVHTKAVWYFDKAPWRAAPKLTAELRVDYADGHTEVIATDEQWKTSTGPIVFDSIYGGETYDARLEKPGWDTPTYDDTGWQPALPVNPPGGKLAAQAMPPIKAGQSIKPVKISEPKPGVFLYDMGQNFSGHVRLHVSGPAGQRIVMRYGERLHPDGTLDASNIEVFVKQSDPTQQFQTDTYVCKGAGQETWQSRFTYHGFQYVEVTGFPGTPSLSNIEGIFTHSTVDQIGAFSCSNPLFNRIWQNTRWSYLSNLQSIPTDCPQREKNGWTGDAHLAAECGLCNFDSITVYEKWINDLGDEQRPTGELPGIVPSSGWGYEWGNGPAWDSAFLLIPWYLYEYYGDTRTLTAHYAGMRRYVDYLTTKANQGIVSIGLGDWVPYETETPVEVTSTAYYYRDALIVAKTAELLGNQDDAKKYAALADSIRAAFNAKFYHADTHTYANGSQTALSCALYQDLVPSDAEKEVADSLCANIRQRNDHIDTGILGAKYLLNTLTDHGRASVAYAIVNQKTLPGWGWWMEQGATTLWESWRGTDSRNHIMFGDVSAWFVKTLAGINGDPAAPGFKHIFIKPHIVGDLTSADAHYDSIHGRIQSAWKKADNRLMLDVQIPGNTTATIYVPAGKAEQITESGKSKERLEANGVHYLRSEPGYAVYEVGSGNYHFESQLL